MSFRTIEKYLSNRRVQSALILCHQNADPDAIGSAFAFSSLLKRVNHRLRLKIASPKGVSRISKIFSDYLPVKIGSRKPLFKNYDLIFMLDTNTIQQMGEWSSLIRDSGKPLIVIDHHAHHPETEKITSLCISDENSSSTCEIVFGFYKELGIKPSRKEAEALFLGIAFDTKHFTLANPATFKTIADLVDAGFNTRNLLSTMSVSMDLSERIARLKSSKRLSLFRTNDWLIVFSNISSYQASAARALIEVGAHVAIVGGERNEQIQISMRANQNFYRKTRFHLGRDLAKPLGEYMHGMGGGHSTSAGMNGIGNFETAVRKAKRILRTKI